MLPAGTHKAPQPAQLLRSKGHTEPEVNSADAACLQGANCTACLAAGLQTGGVLRPARTHQGQNSLSSCKPKHLFKGPPQLNKLTSDKLLLCKPPPHQNPFKQPLLSCLQLGVYAPVMFPVVHVLTCC